MLPRIQCPSVNRIRGPSTAFVLSPGARVMRRPYQSSASMKSSGSVVSSAAWKKAPRFTPATRDATAWNCAGV